ncbi:unnamed protein product [Paramecium pentaurelia]|uniref:Uncharacterized protein n=1 Tax=Paramecium pentaurelia TaxID=43138 RepID=A0A8S1XN46_9CILI|nr:unnamed protein product [Paramecium pentaurelia]
MEQQDMKMCQKHKLEIILVDLERQIAQEDRCLCVRCIIEKMNKKKMNQIDETKNMIKEMKINEQNQIIKDNKKRLDNFNGIEQILRELKQNIDSIFDKIFNNIKCQLNQIQKDIGNIEQQQIIYNFENDIERLSQYQEQQINEQQIKLIENDHKFIEQIQKQLESIINSEQYNKLMNNQNIIINSQLEQDLINNIQNNEIIKIQDYKTPALKFICQEHTKEIIMFNLNSNCNQQPRMACVKCIQQYPAQYTPLEDVNIQWDQYQKRNQTNLNEIQNTRNSIQQKIFKMIQDIKQQNNQIFDELIQSLNNQQQSIEQMNENQINNKSINQLTLNQINEIINQLSQIDKFKTFKDYQINIDKIDKIFYSDLKSRFEHLIQYQLINIQQFNQIIINDNKVINSIDNLLLSNQNKHEDNLQESTDINQIIEQIRQFMYKSFNFEFSQRIFIENIDQYIKLKEEIQNLQQILSNKFEKSQELQNILNEFNNYINKFNQDYIQFQQFLEINQKLNEIQQLKEQIQFIQKEKQEQQTIFENDFQKMKESIEQINKDNLEQKNKLDQQIKGKDQEIKKLNEQIEQINKDNLEQKNKLDQQIKGKDEDIKKLNESIEQINKDNLEQKNKLDQQIKGKDQEIKKLNEQIEQKQNVNNLVPTYKTLFQIVSSQFQKQLTFSQTHKYSSCEVTQNGKMVQNGSYCLCDQVIPKNGVTSFAFKIIQLNERCFIGIGMREIIQKNNYSGGVSNGYGSYTITQNKQCYSHHEKDKDGKQLSFDFAINDIIIVEVDIQNKNIKWIKANTNQSFSLQIDTTYDLYPCLWVQNNKVQILEQLI